MEPHDSPGEGTEPIEYEPPQVVDYVDLEARLVNVTG
jgi:hypothetical protein